LHEGWVDADAVVSYVLVCAEHDISMSHDC
jgi:hypothetical protein